MNNEYNYIGTKKIADAYRSINNNTVNESTNKKPALNCSIFENAKISDAYNNVNKSLFWNSGRSELTEASLSHVLGHQANGYCIVSACRDDWSKYELDKMEEKNPEEFENMSVNEKHKYLDKKYWNNKKTEELAKDLRKLGIGYIPVYGGFKEHVKGDDGKENVVPVYEKSFFLPCYTANKEPIDFEKVKEIAIELGKKYRQESVLINPPDGKPYYYVTTQHSKDGDPVGTEHHDFAKDAKLNDIAQEYFTSLNKVNEYPISNKDASVKRFSYVYHPEDDEETDESLDTSEECCESTNRCEVVEIAEGPHTIMGAHSRFVRGEIFRNPYS